MNRENNFDFLRILAAALVLFSHSFPLFGRHSDPIGWVTGYMEGGAIAVSVFFVVSGFLVSASLINRGKIREYIIARALRILPGLCVVVVICAFVIGPIFTKADPGAYFSSPAVWSYLCNVLIFPIQFTLPHVFESHPHANSVNGSLWTLPIEVVMYLLLIPLRILGALTSRMGLFLPIGAYCAFVIGVNWFDLGWVNRGPVLFWSVDTFNLLRLSVYFFAGSALYLYRDVVKVDGRLALAALALLVATVHTEVGTTAAAVAIPYLVYYSAFCDVPLRKLTAYTGDISYGFYIYAFPVQQCVFEVANGRIEFWGMMGFSLTITSLLAWLSWVLVERPALALKPWFSAMTQRQEISHTNAGPGTRSGLKP